MRRSSGLIGSLARTPIATRGTATTSRSVDREAMHGRAREFLARSQHGRREVGSIRRIGEMLGLQTHAVTLPVGLARRAKQLAIELVAGVELDAWLGGADLHRSPGRRVDQS